MGDKPQDIKSEIADGFEILNLKKVARSAVAFVKDPKRVINSINEGNGEFTKPIKFVLTIGAPALLLLNVLDVNIGGQVATQASESMSSLTSPDPLTRHISKFIHESVTNFIVKISADYNPLLYFLTAPLFAYCTRRVFNNKSLSYYYFLSVAWYLLGFYCFLDLAESLVFGAFGWHSSTSVEIADTLVRFSFSAYVLYSIYEGDRIVKLIKSVASISLSWLAAGLVFLVVIFFVMLIPTYFKVKRLGWTPSYSMGYEVEDLSDSILHARKLPLNRGLWISGVEPFSPAEVSGIKEGDVLLQVNGHAITDQKSERMAIDKVPPDSSVGVVVYRNGKELSLRSSVRPFDSVYRPRKVALGFSDRFEANSVNEQGFTNSALIADVIEGSPAEIAGLKVGDRIVMIDGDTLYSSRALRVASNRYGRRTPGDTTRFTILRKNTLREVTLILKPKSEVYDEN